MGALTGGPATDLPGPTLIRLRWLVLPGLLLGLLALGGTAHAATYTADCPTSDDACKALAQRLEAAQVTNEAQQAQLDGLGAKLDQLHTDLTASPGTTDIAGTVALSPDDQGRLDLTWYGIWLLAGLLVVLIFAPMFVRAFRFWQ